jgi:hypothetical protein
MRSAKDATADDEGVRNEVSRCQLYALRPRTNILANLTLGSWNCLHPILVNNNSGAA